MIVRVAGSGNPPHYGVAGFTGIGGSLPVERVAALPWNRWQDWAGIRKQDRFDTFIGVYNNERPHQALGGLYPGEVYTPSARQYQPPQVPEYPFHDRTILVTQCGRICIGRRKINLSTVFAGQYVGIREIADQIWLVSFMEYDLGFFDPEDNRVQPVGDNPFAPKVLPMSSE